MLVSRDATIEFVYSFLGNAADENVRCGCCFSSDDDDDDVDDGDDATANAADDPRDDAPDRVMYLSAAAAAADDDWTTDDDPVSPPNNTQAKEENANFDCSLIHVRRDRIEIASLGIFLRLSWTSSKTDLSPIVVDDVVAEGGGGSGFISHANDTDIIIIHMMYW